MARPRLAPTITTSCNFPRSGSGRVGIVFTVFEAGQGLGKAQEAVAVAGNVQGLASGLSQVGRVREVLLQAYGDDITAMLQQTSSQQQREPLDLFGDGEPFWVSPANNGHGNGNLVVPIFLRKRL